MLFEICEHGVTSMRRLDQLVTIYQHGDNPEAILRIYDEERWAYSGDWREMISDWLKRVHEYESRGEVA